MVFRFQWTKLFWSRSQKLLDVGTGPRAGAKNFRCLELELELELEPEIRVPSPQPCKILLSLSCVESGKELSLQTMALEASSDENSTWLH